MAQNMTEDQAKEVFESAVAEARQHGEGVFTEGVHKAVLELWRYGFNVKWGWMIEGRREGSDADTPDA